jgi:hypothetical protein
MILGVALWMNLAKGNSMKMADCKAMRASVRREITEDRDIAIDARIHGRLPDHSNTKVGEPVV